MKKHDFEPLIRPAPGLHVRSPGFEQRQCRGPPPLRAADVTTSLRADQQRRLGDDLEAVRNRRDAGVGGGMSGLDGAEMVGQVVEGR